jgi:hypothetical protein
MTDDRRKPWFKFYTGDWRADPGLRRCSFAARGLWADLLGLLWESERPGYLLIDGAPATIADLAKTLGGDPAEIETLLAELLRRGVPGQTPEGIVFSRRMVRDIAKAEAGREAIERRWGPDREAKSGPNRSPITPETRDQKDSLPADAGRENAREGATDGSKRATRIPADWKLDDELRAYATERRLDAEQTAAGFRDYWTAESGARARKLDWRAAFRVWCNREASGGRGRQGNAGAAPSVAAAGAEVLARFRARGAA